MKRVSFRSDADLNEQAQLVARSQNRTLNAAFQEWVKSYVRQVGSVQEFDLLMKRLRHVRPGRHFTRDRMNER